MCLSSVLPLQLPKSSGRYSENLDMCDATTLKHHLTGPNLYYEVRTKNQKYRIRYHSFYKQHKGKSELFIA
jgi:hypothetical protein